MPSFGASATQSRKMQNRNQICRTTTTTTTAATESKSGSVCWVTGIVAWKQPAPKFLPLSRNCPLATTAPNHCDSIVLLLSRFCAQLCAFVPGSHSPPEQVAPFRSNSPPHDLHASHISPARLIVIKPFERNIWSITWKGIIAPFVSSGRRRPATKVIWWTFAEPHEGITFKNFVQLMKNNLMFICNSNDHILSSRIKSFDSQFLLW